jgi:PAS domain S-box-containing protein
MGNIIWDTQEVSGNEKEKQAEQLEWYAVINNTLNELSNALISKGGVIKEISDLFLNHALALTGSQQGYVSEIDPDSGEIIWHAVTAMLESLNMQDEKKAVSFPKGQNSRYPALWGHTLNTKKAFYTNESSKHDNSIGTPPDNFNLHNFLYAPAVVDNEIFGQIALANSPEPYDDRHLEVTERIASLYALAVRHHRMQSELQKYQEGLEEMVTQRTSQLTTMNERYSALLDAMPDSILRFDIEGKILDFKQCEDEIPTTSTGTTISDLAMDNFIQKDFLFLVRRAVETDAIQIFKYKLDSKENQDAQFYEARFVKSDSNEAVCWIRNITEDKQAHDTLRKERDFNQSLIDASPTFFVAIDTNGKVAMMNTAMLNAIGYTKEEAIGKNYIETFVPLEDQELLGKIFTELTQFNQPTLNQNHVLTKEGNRLLVEWHGRSVFKSDCSFEFFFGVGIDISERGHAEEALRESEERFRQMAELLPVTIYESDLQGNIKYANQTAFKASGYTPEDLETGLNLLDLITPEERHRIKQNIPRILAGEYIGGMEYTALRKDGSTFPMANYSSVILKKNKPVGLRGIVIDLTERKDSEEKESLYQLQLMQAEKMATLGTLVTGVAHEINNPNNAIMFNLPMLHDIFNDTLKLLESNGQEERNLKVGGIPFEKLDESVTRLFEAMEDGSKRIKHIVSDLKNFARPDAYDLTQWIQVNDMLKSSLALLNNLIKKSTRYFSIEYGKNIPKIRGNFQRLEQVVINLIQNACQSLPNRNRGITVTTNHVCIKDQDIVIITVEDRGRGISKDDLKFITDPFFTTKRDEGGTGLGLSITQRIIEDHQGTLEFKSKPGKGSVFTVTLPVTVPVSKIVQGHELEDTNEQ